MELLARIADEPVELRAVGALETLLELGVDVQGHLRVGVADLAHDPLDVEVVREQRNRDVGAPEAVRRRARQRWKTAGLQPLGGEDGGLPDDRGDALAREAASAHVGDEIGIRGDGRAGALQPVEVLDDRLHEIRAHLDLADPGVRLRVRDPEPGSIRVVQADLADAQVTELARAHARAAEDLADHTPADVAAGNGDLVSFEMELDGRLRKPELRGDLSWPEARCRERRHGCGSPGQALWGAG